MYVRVPMDISFDRGPAQTNQPQMTIIIRLPCEPVNSRIRSRHLANILCVVVLSLQGVDSSAANLELGWRVRKSTCFPFCRRQARERGYQLHAAGFFCCALVVALTLWHSNMSFLLFTTVCSANTSTGQFFRKLAKSPSASAAPGIFGTGWILYSGAGPCPCGRIMHLGSIFRQWLMLS